MKRAWFITVTCASVVLLLARTGHAQISLAVENPAANQTVSGIKVISGWAFSTVPGAQITSVRMLIDGQHVADLPCCVDRLDVAQAFGEQARNSGFGGIANFNLLTAGTHTFAIEVHDSAGSPPRIQEFPITIVKPGGVEFLALLALFRAQPRISGQEIIIDRVVLQEELISPQQEATIRLAWHENSQSLEIIGVEGTSTTTARQLMAEATTTSTGSTQRASTGDESIMAILENPPEANTSIGAVSVGGIGAVSGWTFSQTPGATIDNVQLRVDGQSVFDVPCCFERADVAAAHSDQPQALVSGFGAPVNFNLLPSGTHNIGVDIRDSTGAERIIDHEVTAVKMADSEFLDLFDFSSATIGTTNGSRDLLLDGVRVRDKATQRTQEIAAVFRWQASCQCFVAQPVCGNGSVELSEECDGIAFAGESCTSLGFSGGTLSCFADCQFDTSECTGGPSLYVTNTRSNTVSVVNLATHTVTNTITVGREPRGVAISPDGSTAYVTNFRDNTVSVIETSSRAVVGTIVVGGGPQGVVFRPDGARAYVVNSSANNVSVIDTSTRAVLTTVGVGRAPQDVAVTPDGTRGYVTNLTDDSVTVLDLDTNTVIGTVGVGGGPSGVAVQPDGTRVYVANFDSTSVSVIDTSTNEVVETVLVDLQPIRIAFSPDGDRAFVTSFLETVVTVINTNTLERQTPMQLGDNPHGIVVTTGGRRTYVALFGRSGDGRFVQILNTRTGITFDFLSVGAGPVGIAVTPGP